MPLSGSAARGQQAGEVASREWQRQCSSRCDRDAQQVSHSSAVRCGPSRECRAGRAVSHTLFDGILKPLSQSCRDLQEGHADGRGLNRRGVNDQEKALPANLKGIGGAEAEKGTGSGIGIGTGTGTGTETGKGTGTGREIETGIGTETETKTEIARGDLPTVGEMMLRAEGIKRVPSRTRKKPTHPRKQRFLQMRWPRLQSLLLSVEPRSRSKCTILCKNLA